MSKPITTGGMKIFMTAAVISSIAAMILSAFAASTMYLPTQDKFSSSLGSNLSTLCENAGYGLSATQLSIIENAEIKSIQYDNDSEGNKVFSARLRLSAPSDNAGKYSDENPRDYLDKTVKTMFNGHSAEIEIVGLCGSDEGDHLPAVEIDTLEKIAETTETVWQKESLSSSKNFEYALTDMIIPEPFPDRAFQENGSYQPTYSRWLDECAGQFASEGLAVTTENGASSEVSEIRSAMEQVITPYLCSVRNISLSHSEDKKGYLTLSFDSLDVIGTLSTAKKPSVSALNKLSGVYSEDRVLKVTIHIDLVDLLSDGGKMKLPFFNIIRAITRYGSSIGTSLTKIKIPETTQVIDGKSNGQWPLEFKRAKGDGNIIVDVIRMDDSGEEKHVLKIFLTDGGKITVCLKQGKYRLNYAVGTTFYGSKELFGANGIYMKDTQNIYTVPSKELKTVKVEKQPGESLSFTDYLLGQGVDPSLIDRSEF